MKHGDIDDLLVNIDGNLEEITPAKEPSRDAEKIVSPNTSADLSFLENIDSNKPPDGNNGDESIEEELTGDFSEIADKDAGKTPEGKNKDKPQASTEEWAGKEFERINFILKGTRSWNTREPYIAPVNHERLNADYKDLSKTFYFIKEDSNEQAAQGEMKRAMFKFIRAPEKNIIEGYSGFLNSRLFSLTAELGNNFGFQGDKLYLFVYHLGVLTLYKIIINTFQSFKSGYCFKLMPGNSVVKYIPAEFIKETILKWHNDNIKSDDLPYDAIFEYNELKRLVAKFYAAEYEKNNKKIDDLILKSNLNMDRSDREQFLKSKWDEWFGKTNIFVYNRFLERTIFKTVR